MGLDLDAYLVRIGHRGAVEPTVACLAGLHLAHVTSIPFENLDVVLGRPIRLDIDSLQAKLVRGGRGGYCFEHNTLFAAVLEAIGFPVTRLAARVIHGPQVSPRTHMVLRVAAEQTSWLADVGFGGASILEPIPFEAGPDVEQFGWRFRLVDDADGARRLQRLGPDCWLDYYTFTLERQYPIDYEVANHYTSTHPDSRFVRALTAQLPARERSMILRGLTLTEVTPSSEVETQIAAADLVAVLADRFGLILPEGTTLPVTSPSPPGAAPTDTSASGFHNRLPSS